MPDEPFGRPPGQLSAPTTAPPTNRRPAIIVALVVAALLVVAFVVWQSTRSDSGSQQENEIRAAIAAQSPAASVAPPASESENAETNAPQPAGVVADPDQPGRQVSLAQEERALIMDPHTPECTSGTYDKTICDQPEFTDGAVHVTVTWVAGASSAGDTIAAPGFTFRSFSADYTTASQLGKDTGLSWRVTRDGRTIDKGEPLRQTDEYASGFNGSAGISFTASVHDLPTPPQDDAATVLEIVDHGKTIWRFRLDDATVLS